MKLWPIGKFPVLEDKARNEIVPESSIIIEYLGRHYPGPTQFIPEEPDRALQTRLRDRFYDLYVHLPMQKIVGDRLRPAGKKDPHGVAEARAQLRTSYAHHRASDGGWRLGDGRASSALPIVPRAEPLLRQQVEPFGEFKNVSAYLERLTGAALLRAGAQGGRTLFRLVPEGSGISRTRAITPEIIPQRMSVPHNVIRLVDERRSQAARRAEIERRDDDAIS